MSNNHGGKRENAGRKKRTDTRKKHKNFFLSNEEIEKVNLVLNKIKKEYNYKYDVDAFIHIINNCIVKESKNEKNQLF